jgi:hypothetical protein
MKPNSTFLFLFRDPAGVPVEPTATQVEKLFAWFDKLRADGQLLAVSPLGETPAKTLRGADTELVTDGPFVEAKELVAGYMLVAAKNFAEAVSIAKQFPVFSAGTSLEVRRIAPVARPTPHP